MIMTKTMPVTAAVIIPARVATSIGIRWFGTEFPSDVAVGLGERAIKDKLDDVAVGLIDRVIEDVLDPTMK